MNDASLDGEMSDRDSKGFERALEVERRRVAVFRLFSEGLLHDLLELRWVRWDELRRRGYVPLDDRAEAKRLGVLRPEEPRPRRELVEHDAHAEDVAATIEGLSEHLLRGHVSGLALDGAVGRLAEAIGRLGDPEVDDLDATVVGHDDIRG
jgi:hypothetical protein